MIPLVVSAQRSSGTRSHNPERQRNHWFGKNRPREERDSRPESGSGGDSSTTRKKIQ
jgi:hypothetical protein